MSVLSTIVGRRTSRIAIEGPELGVPVPEHREVPLVPFPAPPGVICEVKRHSPSRGDIDADIDVLSHIENYVHGGARAVSVLTEEDHFHGSLQDLITAKREFPHLSFLRKDFLSEVADIDVSFRAGADAVLLIASVLDQERLRRLHDLALYARMTPLVEIHNVADLEKIRALRPACVGCNSRDLERFTVDLLAPLALRAAIDWPCTTVFESGIHAPEHAELALSGGFDAILVGESVVRDPSLVSGLVASVGEAAREEGRQSGRGGAGRFWRLVAERKRRRGSSPLVKICGLTRMEDVVLADRLGADFLGFVLAPSRRRVSAAFLRSLPQTRALRVAVIVSGTGASISEVKELFAEGCIDAIQYHGEETPEECSAAGVPYYKAVQIGSQKDLPTLGTYFSPRILVDARDASSRGGNGRRIDGDLVAEVSKERPLWLAGGLHPDTIGAVIARFAPELVDVSSGVESAPGVKDEGLLKHFFASIDELLDVEVERGSRR